MFGKWIPVVEDLPKRNDWYLVSYKDGTIGRLFYVRVENTWYDLYRDADIVDSDRIIAWMEQPEPYDPNKVEVIEVEVDETEENGCDWFWSFDKSIVSFEFSNEPVEEKIILDFNIDDDRAPDNKKVLDDFSETLNQVAKECQDIFKERGMLSIKEANDLIIKRLGYPISFELLNIIVNEAMKGAK